MLQWFYLLVYDYSDEYNLAASFNYSERAPSGEELYSSDFTTEQAPTYVVMIL